VLLEILQQSQLGFQRVQVASDIEDQIENRAGHHYRFEYSEAAVREHEYKKE